MSEDVPLERDENGAVLTYIVPMEYFRGEGKRMTDVRARASGQERDAQGRFKRKTKVYS